MRGDLGRVGSASEHFDDVHEPAVLGDADPDKVRLFITRLHQVCAAVRFCPVPVIGRINGFCLGGGLEMALSAVDWDQDFASVRGQLNLPPGWRLLHTIGVDEVDDTWLQRWTLLDISLVLVISIAIARLYGWAWGTLAVVTLALAFPEWMAPRTVWIFVLVGEALSRALPEGKLRGLARVYRLSALVTLTGIVIAFTVQQVRGGLYPALAVRSDDDGFGLRAFDNKRSEPAMVEVAATAEAMAAAVAAAVREPSRSCSAVKASAAAMLRSCAWAGGAITSIVASAAPLAPFRSALRCVMLLANGASLGIVPSIYSIGIRFAQLRFVKPLLTLCFTFTERSVPQRNSSQHFTCRCGQRGSPHAPLC